MHRRSTRDDADLCSGDCSGECPVGTGRVVCVGSLDVGRAFLERPLAPGEPRATAGAHPRPWKGRNLLCGVEGPEWCRLGRLAVPAWRSSTQPDAADAHRCRGRTMADACIVSTARKPSTRGQCGRCCACTWWNGAARRAWRHASPGAGRTVIGPVPLFALVGEEGHGCSRSPAPRGGP